MRREGSFQFTPEFGQRLRAVRKRAGLSQRRLAELMGINCLGAHSVIGQLERGEVAHPALGIVADYLRACRASFHDLEDLLDNYTARPTLPELAGREEVAKLFDKPLVAARQETERYDRALADYEARRFRRPAEPWERAARAAKYASSAVWRRTLHKLVVVTIDRLKLHSGGSYPEKRLQDYSLRLWKKLSRVRAHTSRYQEMQDEVMAELLADGSVPEATGRAVLSEVTDLFQQARDSGQFESFPDNQ